MIPTIDNGGRRLGLAAAVLCIVSWAAAAQAVPRSLDDADVSRAIETELWTDQIVDAHAIDATTRDGIVTLSGSVSSLLARDRAEEIAETTVGVRAVVNRIEVAGFPRDDDALAEAVEAALLRDPATDSYEIEVSAAQGSISLSGSVDSWAEKQLAESVAKGVRGVREVKNMLVVAVPERPDVEIAADVRARLWNDVRVDDQAIEVVVDDGVVLLSGAVGSLAEKHRARANAWVAGVEAVDSDALEVQWWARDAMRRQDAFATRPDAEIAEAVRDALLYDPRVKAFNPHVHVSGGVVTLSGVVDNPGARRAAAQDARNVVGVRTVLNHLKVRPDPVPPNDVLEGRVRQALAEDPYVERWQIDVDAYSGWVYLSGDVNNSFEKGWAEWLAQRTNGTVEVVNNIEYEHEWSWKPDPEIRESVKSQIFWSPFVDADEVKVAVADGVVTLRGTVDTWAERAAAEENAWEGGAKSVQNQLDVEHEAYGPFTRPYPPLYY